ncbi:iron reductase domain protein [Pleomassaria siparia CBS 279.74]|uniref:Iron reductase domain protein n=1 Tax=Pleomassaria siparia CBS 279.74 TaxID=1314801 RepID=A0A6G1JUL2_9PLEO|nr:iron reductase domain protein [Pleomassaria siparia CBS 279.74]
MRCTFGFVWAASLLGSSLGGPVKDLYARDNAVTYFDPETGFTFSEFKAAYSLSSNILYRVAVPSSVPAGAAYDAVLQIVAPNQVGWAGLAWGGTMPKNPLTVGWPNGAKPNFSSRYASGHTMPTAFTGATYQQFTTGNKSNGTHWTLTVKCTGCTSYTGTNGAVRLNPTGTNRFAFAYATAKPTTPGSNTTNFGMHDVFNYWSHDFSQGQNPTFATLVVKNGGTTTSGDAAL